MAQEPIAIPSLQAFSEKLTQILTTGTLYRPFFYQGPGLHHKTRSGEFGQTVTFALLPPQLKMFCSDQDCMADEWWQLERRESAFYFGHEEPQHEAYRCRNCGREKQHYWIEWSERNPPGEGQDAGVIIKVGQWPPLSIEPPSDLAKILGKEDANLYKKALINASISHGVGALAYFRRVIENKVNQLIDLIAEAAQAAHTGADELKHIEAVKTGFHIDRKIEFAKGLLPAHLGVWQRFGTKWAIWSSCG
jgi:hypothetical protein